MSRLILKRKELKERLHKLNLKVTLPRLAIFEILQKSSNHPDAKTIYDIMKEKFEHISLATVYNTLRQLSRLGVIQEIALPSGISRFDADLSLHIHLICRSCQQVEDFDYISGNIKKNILKLRREIRKESGFETLNIGLFFSGLCQKCGNGVGISNNL